MDFPESLFVVTDKVRGKGQYVTYILPGVDVTRDKKVKSEDVDGFHTLGRGEGNRKTEEGRTPKRNQRQEYK
jgi:hypothetical protein